MIRRYLSEAKKPNSRLTKTGIEDIIRRIGEKAGVENAHPHRFRRTALTNALNRGMPLQEAMIFADTQSQRQPCDIVQ